MNYFLAKADPDHDYGIDDLARDGQTVWDGVHSNAALLAIRGMRPGDHVYIYHSQKEKAIVGEAIVVGEPFENKSDPRRSWAVELKFLRKFTQPLTLNEIKAAPELQDFALVRQSRLSTMSVPASIATWLESHLQ